MNREQWLTRLMRSALPMFEKARKGCTADAKNWRVSCGFPGGGSARKRIGECWSQTCSKDGLVEMFISPVLGTAEEVTETLIHEMVHAAVGVKCGHKGPFVKVMHAVGLTGKPTATVAGPELRERLNALCDKLGPYPHAALSLATRKKQTTRLIKLECSDCGYIVRTTAKWLDHGVPTCCCGGEFVC